MKKINKWMGISSVVLGILVLVNGGLLAHIKSVLEMERPADWKAMLVAGIILIMGAILLVQHFGIVRQIQALQRESMLRSVVFVAGFFCLFLLAVNVVFLQDIGQEWKAGFESSGEWNVIWFSHGMLALYALMMFLQTRQVKKQPEPSGDIAIEKDEAVFLSVHQIGIFSALLGFLCMFALRGMQVPAGYLDGLFVICSVVALIPYGLAVLYWLGMKRRERITEWYDEKQFIDISRGALITLLVTVSLSMAGFGLVVFQVIQIGLMIWFPIYLCVTLLVFSLSNQVIAKGGFSANE